MQLKGKRIILTGGASGIGAATLKAYASEGAAVFSLDINDEMGNRSAAEAAQMGLGPIIYRHCDISNQDAVNAAFEEATSILGGLDVLAMIAGIGQLNPAEFLTAKDLDRQYDVHVKGTAFTNGAAFKSMQKTGGSIINYASYAGVCGMPGMPSYSAAKGAVLGYSRTIAKDWGPYGIRVNIVCPGVMTELAQSWYDAADAEQRAKIDEWQKHNIPLSGKLGNPEDAAALNVFLASDGSRFITGQTIAVDGGMTMPR